MRAAALRRLACLIVLAFACFAPPRARAEPQISTIYLTSGGMVRGEVVMDMPGSPLTVMVAGQAVQVPRETISRIDPPAVAAPVVQPTVAQVAPNAYPAQLVAAPSAYPAQGVAAPPPGSPIVLQVDRRGRAPVQGNWSPELQQLVLRRNDLAHSMKRKGLAAPITMLSLGAIGVIGTAAGAAAAANSYESCLADNATYTSLSYRGCSNASGLIMAVGYSLSSALVAGGGTFLLVRLLRRKSLKRQLAAIDQDLRRFNVAPIAQASPRAGATVRVAGLTLRASF